MCARCVGDATARQLGSIPEVVYLRLSAKGSLLCIGPCEELPHPQLQFKQVRLLCKGLQRCHGALVQVWVGCGSGGVREGGAT